MRRKFVEEKSSDGSLSPSTESHTVLSLYFLQTFFSVCMTNVESMHICKHGENFTLLLHV